MTVCVPNIPSPPIGSSLHCNPLHKRPHLELPPVPSMIQSHSTYSQNPLLTEPSTLSSQSLVIPTAHIQSLALISLEVHVHTVQGTRKATCSPQISKKTHVYMLYLY